MASEDSIEIPPEIITNILHRLPSKPLTRFKTVSKNWQSLISDPQFIKHHQKTLNRRHLICDIYNTPLYSFPINPHHQTPQNLTRHLPHTDKFTFHGSCNGLVLASADDFDGAHSLIVINPTTRECIQVPESGYDVVDKLLQVDIKYGFGYDPLTDDYKDGDVAYKRRLKVVAKWAVWIKYDTRWVGWIGYRVRVVFDLLKLVSLLNGSTAQSVGRLTHWEYPFLFYLLVTCIIDMYRLYSMLLIWYV
ncbi:F-box/kelch-repeat protein At3g06240 isoform X2 [Helianthus annuus]|uniref:F-box/kelch-repeat protein At3g06240 isoform X2 n=1 Tax=Helianthus annuus TaxID=4232 RepID=UPI000B8F80F1|nr:F-box/kelch-repeat protein At3g06240 isoform X2 [Helianthus annuus]